MFANVFNKTATRVEDHSPAEINLAIAKDIKHRIARYAAAPEEELRERLAYLDAEWDVERALEANFAGVAFLGMLLSRADRRFLALPVLAAVFMLQHVGQGWCPPLPLLRRMGFRTAREIEHERNALLTALRSRTQAEREWTENI